LPFDLLQILSNNNNNTNDKKTNNYNKTLYYIRSYYTWIESEYISEIVPRRADCNDGFLWAAVTPR